MHWCHTEAQTWVYGPCVFKPQTYVLLLQAVPWMIPVLSSLKTVVKNIMTVLVSSLECHCVLSES